MQKALLYALLTNHNELKALQDDNDLTTLMVRHEEYKTLPFGAVWQEYLRQQGLDESYLSAIKEYEQKVLRKRI